MIELTLNGEKISITQQTLLTLLASVCDQSPPPQGVAVAIDGVVIRRSEWSTTQLLADSDIEVLWASSGG